VSISISGDSASAVVLKPEAKRLLDESGGMLGILDHMLNGVAFCKMIFKDGVPVDWMYLYTNAAFHSQTGLGQVVGRYVSEVIPGIRNSDPQLFEIYGRVASGGSSEKFEFFVDGLNQWFNIQVFSPKQEYFVAVFDSITERKQREQELLTTQRRLSLALKSSGSGAWDWDVARGTFVWTEEFFQLFGIDSATAKASFETWRSVLHPDDLLTAEENIAAAIGNHVPLFNEYRIILPSGSTRWIAAYGDMAYDEQGQPLRMTGICIDVTRMKEVEANHRLLSEISAHAAEGISLVRASDGTIVYTNHRFDEMFGYAAGELIGRPVAIINAGTEKAPEDTATDIVRALESTGRWSGELLNVRKDGTTFWTRASVSGFEHSGFGRVWVTLQTDITEKRKAEFELLQLTEVLESRVEERTRELSLAKAAAEAASAAKSSFLANMSHELRTPMTAIMGMVDLVLRKSTDPKHIDQLTKAKVASQHLLSVINDILDISKIEAEKITLERVHFRIGDVLEDLLSVIGPRASSKGVALHVNVPPVISRMPFFGDPVRLEQILINFASNAVKFTEHGKITIQATLIEDNPTNALLRWDVCDTGIGIALGDQQRMFRPFEQADGSTTRKYGGTGLGLAISKRLAELMGGEVGVKSQPNQGSNFWFTVRLDKDDQPVDIAPDSSHNTPEALIEAGFAGTRILLAEDDPFNREVLLGMLAEVGLKIDLAEDGSVAIALAKQHRYALILMDMQMPYVSGVDATRAIRSESMNTDVPILAITANAFEEDRQVCLDAGMNDHIAKPVNPKVLFVALLKWLSAANY
jgi:PAS domain S-box-containing protein